jgi:hypothetical protein
MMEGRSSPSEPISKGGLSHHGTQIEHFPVYTVNAGAECVSNSLPDIVTTGQSKSNPRIKVNFIIM